MINRDGTVTYSTILKLSSTGDSSATTTFTIAPNPVDNQLQLRVRTQIAQQAIVRIVEAGSTMIRVRTCMPCRMACTGYRCRQWE